MDGKYVVLLILLLAIYLCIGAGLFLWTESAEELIIKKQAMDTFLAFMDNNSCANREEVVQLIRVFLQTSVHYGGMDVVRMLGNSTNVLWDFTGAFTFSVTIVTTIGYGNTHPVTYIGKTLCVVYALFGIPLALMVLGEIGNHLSSLRGKVHRLQLNPDSPDSNRWINMALLVIGGLLLMFVIPSSIFCSREKWNLIDSIYFCFITLSTIGLGDFVPAVDPSEDEPSRTIYRLTVYIWIFLGLSYLSLVIKSFTKIFAKRAKLVQEKVATQNFPFMNGITINVPSEESESGEDSISEGISHIDGTGIAKYRKHSNTKQRKLRMKHNKFLPGVAAKKRSQINDIIDLDRSNDKDIQLLRVSSLQSRY